MLIPSADQVIISRSQRRVHVIGEVLALTAVVPFMGYVATRKALPTWARVGAGLVGLGSLLIDGFLLIQFARNDAS